MPANQRLNIEDRMLSEIADSIIALLINESEESLVKIKNAVKQASIKYNEEEYNWLIRSILTHWRSRKSEAKNTEKDINTYTDVLTRLKTFANVFLNPEGAWESTSLNTLLVVHLLGAIDDESKPCDQTFYSAIASKLALPLKLKLQEWVHQYEYQKKISDEKARNLKSMSDKNFETTLSTIKLFAGSKEASQHAIHNPGQVVFRLFLKEDQWKLVWYDLLGEKNSLNISDELKPLLASARQDLNYLNNPELKSECLKLRDILIEGRKVLINPPPSDMTDLRKLFILKLTKGDYSLQWYDADSVCRPIDLSKYPDFLQLLDSVDSIDDQTRQQIERHLRRVNVLTKFEINRHIKSLDNFFKFKGAEAAPTFELMVNPQSHQLAGLESTFVLYIKDEAFRLEWYDAFAKGQEIDIAAYPQINKWMKAQETIEKEDYPELKHLLAQIDTSKAMDRSEFKAQLKACLEKNLHKKSTDPLPQPEKKEGVEPGKLETSKEFLTQLEACFGKNSHKKSTDPLPQPEKKEGVVPGKLKPSEYAIAGLFGHKDKPAATGESQPEKSVGLEM